MSVKKAMTSEPSEGSTKAVYVESKEVATFGSFHLCEEYFGL